MLPQTFHPIIHKWFTDTYGNPTSVQDEAWALIEQGENVLALAPTGSGKTLTAFLSVISRFCSDGKQKYNAEKLSVIYISPLKALNEDIKRNLLEPLAEIKSRFEKENLPFPPVRVETRSGDTPQSQRRRFYIHPPSILALTPESLAIILLNPKGRHVLSNVKYLIIDEVHALLGNKRGAYLSCQIERLALIAGEFQRISLSATVRNPQLTAEFVGGIGRKVNIVSPPAEKKIDFSIEFPDADIEITPNKKSGLSGVDRYGSRYTPLIEYILRRIWEGSTLLVFAESRRRAERLCYFINQEAASFFARNGYPEGIKARLCELKGTVAFPHHGSLSKEIRRTVEKGLAEGRLPCVVATASLELGIDIGSIDEVILAGSTANVSQALQRIGRSGHKVGQTSKGKLFAFHGMDLLAAAALKSAVDERDIEEIKPIENPQDILAQLILSLCCEKDRKIDELYELITKFYIFKNLKFDTYNRVVQMLAGLASGSKRGDSTRLRDIKPRIWLDKIEGTIGKLDGTVTLLYSSGGVIANRGLYSMRLSDGTKIGELDEEFVWERSIGDCFDFGARGWRVTSIGHEAVEVTPLEKRADFIPFWKSDTQFRSSNLTQRILAILDYYNNISEIKTTLSSEANDSLKAFLNLQHSMQKGAPLPDNKNIIIEIIKGTELNRDFCSVVLHSFRGGRINYPLSLALSNELEQKINLRTASFSNDDSILFLIPRLGLEEINTEELLRNALFSLDNIDENGLTYGERLFRNRLESSGVFGANFREAAERSLLLPKAPFGKRTPLWIMRQRSKRLFDAVADEDGFPVTAESWRSCLVDIFDMEGFRDLISSIKNGSISLSFFQTNIPSPFSRDTVRQETNTFMYEYDERADLAGAKSATLSDKVIEEAIGNADLRPVLKQSVIESFTSRLRRELTDYAPDDALSLNEWVKERIAIPKDEWDTLCSVMPKALVENIDASQQAAARIKTVTRKGAVISSVVHREWEETWISEPLSLLGQWLRYEGTVSIERICSIFGVSANEAEDAVNALSEVDEVIREVAVLDEKEEKQYLICDRENLEMLLRLSRKKERPVIKERPSSLLVPFLALRQGLACNDNTVNTQFRKNLYAWTASAKLWETEMLCARNSFYDAEKLNKELREGLLVWYGAGKEKIGFCRPEDLDLIYLKTDEKKRDAKLSPLSHLAETPFFSRPRDFWEIKNELKTDSRTCAQALWNKIWQGSLTSDSFDPVRNGLQYGFIPKEIEIPRDAETVIPFGRQPRIPAALKNRWKGGAPVSGNWFSLIIEEQESIDAIEEDALNRDRVRLLLDRWGILCRPLLEHEDAIFSWSKLLPAMRRMELAGELVTGRFFSGVNSLQFASPSIAAELEQAESFNKLYWMNAADPASIAGTNIENLDYKLCARSAGNRIYYRGASVIAISVKSGKEIQILIEADDRDIMELIAMIKIPRTRNVMPEKKIQIEKINGQTAAQSEYVKSFKDSGFVSDRGKLIFW
ncbi:MAG: DEAD/DEAH box helicase [Treponema sp.]|nr:DEAD/DEAH box helicase [Treponema sp.]MCL2251684.1 DEAD/DEAH box helicase [Treponema sp.]